MELFAPNQKLIIQKHEKLTISSEKKLESLTSIEPSF
jgi:hypothetical protein